MRVIFSYTIDQAKSHVLGEGFSDFENETRFSLRQAEMYTIATIPCECNECLHGISNCVVPTVILGAERYNDRSPSMRYGK